MKSFLLPVTFIGLIAMPIAAVAQSNAIQFDQMSLGVEFHFENFKQTKTWKKRYAGIEDGLHVLETYSLDDAGDLTKLTRTEKFDAEGREVWNFIHKGGVYSSYAPFSCNYAEATTDCSHEWTYPNSLSSDTAEYFNKTSRYSVARSGDTLLVTMIGKKKNYPITYELGEYNMRVKQSSTRKEKVRGHQLVKIVEP